MTDSDIRAPDQVPLYFGEERLCMASLTPIHLLSPAMVENWLASYSGLYVGAYAAGL